MVLNLATREKGVDCVVICFLGYYDPFMSNEHGKVRRKGRASIEFHIVFYMALFHFYVPSPVHFHVISSPDI